MDERSACLLSLTTSQPGYDKKELSIADSVYSINESFAQIGDINIKQDITTEDQQLIQKLLQEDEKNNNITKNNKKVINDAWEERYNDIGNNNTSKNNITNIPLYNTNSNTIRRKTLTLEDVPIKTIGTGVNALRSINQVRYTSKSIEEKSKNDHNNNSPSTQPPLQEPLSHTYKQSNINNKNRDRIGDIIRKNVTTEYDVLMLLSLIKTLSRNLFLKIITLNIDSFDNDKREYNIKMTVSTDNSNGIVQYDDIESFYREEYDIISTVTFYFDKNDIILKISKKQ